MPNVDKVVLEMTKEEAHLYAEFLKRYGVIAQLVGYMEAVNIFDLKNMSIQMNIDNTGVVKHTSITRHFRV